MKLRELLERFAWSYLASQAELHILTDSGLKKIVSPVLQDGKLVFQIEVGIFDKDLLLQ